MRPIVVVLPIRLRAKADSAAVGRHDQLLQASACRNEHQRAAAALKALVVSAGYVAPPGAVARPLSPVTVTLTRLAPTCRSDDGLYGLAWKYVRAGIAESLGVDDGDSRVSFQYAQRRSAPGYYAVEVRIEERRDSVHAEAV